MSDINEKEVKQTISMNGNNQEIQLVSSDFDRGTKIIESLSDHKYTKRMIDVTGSNDLLKKVSLSTPSVLILLWPIPEISDFGFLSQLRKLAEKAGFKTIVIDQCFHEECRRAALFFGADLYIAEPLTQRAHEAILSLVQSQATT